MEVPYLAALALSPGSGLSSSFGSKAVGFLGAIRTVLVIRMTSGNTYRRSL